MTFLVCGPAACHSYSVLYLSSGMGLWDSKELSLINLQIRKFANTYNQHSANKTNSKNLITGPKGNS